MARYGDQQTPFSEEMKPKPVDPYAISKVASEQVLKNLCVLKNFKRKKDLHGSQSIQQIVEGLTGAHGSGCFGIIRQHTSVT